MKLLKNLSLTIILFLVGCTSQEKNKTIVFKDQKENRSEDIFKIQNDITFNFNSNDSVRFYDLTKIIELNNNNLLLLDRFNTSIYLLDSLGNVKKRLVRKGNGPGEFNMISDFCIDSKCNIYVLDFSNRVGKFSKDGIFLRNYELSFSHRVPESIEYLVNGNFLISAHQNLEDGAVRNSYKFLEYDEIKNLHFYDSNFTKKKSFLTLNSKLKKTKGRLARGRGPFVSSSIQEKNILTFTQEGYYELSIFNLDGDLLEKINFVNSKFSPLNFNLVNSMDFTKNKWNLNLEEIGAIISSHSSIRLLTKVGEYYIVSVYEPYENYYPQFRKNYHDKFHFDIFRYKSGKIEPIVSNIKSKYKIIGVGKRGIIYLTPDEYDNNKELHLIKANLNL